LHKLDRFHQLAFAFTICPKQHSRFGKEKIVEKDVTIFLPFLAEISGLPAFEKGLFQAVLERLEIFYGELDNAERVAEGPHPDGPIILTNLLLGIAISTPLNARSFVSPKSYSLHT
jgi:hypothetical protein